MRGTLDNSEIKSVKMRYTHYLAALSAVSMQQEHGLNKNERLMSIRPLFHFLVSVQLVITDSIALH